MAQWTIITDEAVTADAVTGPGGVGVLVPPAVLHDLLGWELTPGGLCRGDVCVPVADRSALERDGRVDLEAAATAVGRPVVADHGLAVAAVAQPAELRRRALEQLEAPPFALPDLDGTVHALDEWAGTKRLLVTFSSWCGCRYDLPGWQALHDELAGLGFTVVAVAIDHDPEQVRPFTGGITFPVLYDPQHLLTELYAISNVPTVVWIDGDGRIVRPNGEAFATDLFREVTGAASAPHLDAVRAWVRHGTVPLDGDEARAAVADLSEEEVRARLHFRIAAQAERRGDAAATRRHVEAASALAPDDLTVWRAGMPLVGEDPFGQAFFDRYEAWRAKGSPFHGIPADRPADLPS